MSAKLDDQGPELALTLEEWAMQGKKHRIVLFGHTCGLLWV